MEENYYFASANTGVGFVNCFKFINEGENQGFQFILKGGAGTGKNTLMKKVAEHFFKQGFSLEKFYCSSDYNSLDGVRIVEKNISIVDGTAPHITEASLPAIRQKIVDIGAYINPTVKEFEQEILDNLKHKKLFFDLLYKDINCALNLQSENQEILKNYVNENNIKKMCSEVFKKISLDSSGKKPNYRNRKLFLSAFNEGGIFCLKNLNRYNNIFQFEANDFEAQFIFKKLQENINLSGYKTTKFLNIINPNLIDAILINEKDALIINKENSNKNYEKIKNNAKILEKFKKNEEIIEIFEKSAGNNLTNAKFYHKEVEKFYIKNMDFSGINNLTKNLISEIESY